MQYKYCGEWRSLVAQYVRDVWVGGSNPLSPTNFFSNSQMPIFLLNLNLINSKSVCRAGVLLNPVLPSAQEIFLAAFSQSMF